MNKKQLKLIIKRFREQFCHKTKLGIDLDLDNFNINQLEKFILKEITKTLKAERQEHKKEIKEANEAGYECGHSNGFDLSNKHFKEKLKAQRQEIIEMIDELVEERDNNKNHPLVSFQDVGEEIKTKIKSLK